MKVSHIFASLAIIITLAGTFFGICTRMSGPGTFMVGVGQASMDGMQTVNCFAGNNDCAKSISDHMAPFSHYFTGFAAELTKQLMTVLGVFGALLLSAAAAFVFIFDKNSVFLRFRRMKHFFVVPITPLHLLNLLSNGILNAKIFA